MNYEAGFGVVELIVGLTKGCHGYFGGVCIVTENISCSGADHVNKDNRSTHKKAWPLLFTRNTADFTQRSTSAGCIEFVFAHVNVNINIPSKSTFPLSVGDIII